MRRVASTVRAWIAVVAVADAVLVGCLSTVKAQTIPVRPDWAVQAQIHRNLAERYGDAAAACPALKTVYHACAAYEDCMARTLQPGSVDSCSKGACDRPVDDNVCVKTPQAQKSDRIDQPEVKLAQSPQDAGDQSRTASTSPPSHSPLGTVGGANVARPAHPRTPETATGESHRSGSGDRRGATRGGATSRRTADDQSPRRNRPNPRSPTATRQPQ